jgi:hypothetical protein
MATDSMRRRRFLAVLGSGTAGVVGAIAVRDSTPLHAPAAAGPEAAGHSGYRMTEHIAKYYKTTKV